MSDAEYNILNKMNHRLGSVWVHPIHKASSAKPNVQDILKTALNEHQEEI